MKLVRRGAEADIYRTEWNGSRAILKVRRPRRYRNAELDSRIRRHRTHRESQAISQAKALGVPAPLVYAVDRAASSILMQEIPGRPVHDLPDRRVAELCGQMGRIAGALHAGGMMHGDLTTSNFVLHAGRLYAIDFGLSQATVRPEDHAVDLRLIKEILNSAHARVMGRAWRNLLAGYGGVVGAARRARILRLVSDIEGRGRYAAVV